MSDNKNFIMVIELICHKLISSEKLLTDLDSEIGDGDCGSGIKRGFTAVLNSVPTMAEQPLGTILKKIGFTLASTIGGTSGAILGTGFMELGKNIGDNEDVTLLDWANASKKSLEKMKLRGENTKVGDKTLIDALEPAINGISLYVENGRNDTKELLEIAHSAAVEGSNKTKDMIARKGRASYLGERSIGKIDPGSVVICLIFEAALDCYK